MNHDAIFVLSTGRCGTQWLHNAMATCYGDAILSTHEPLSADYRPRHFFRAAPAQMIALGKVPAVAKHVANIRDCLRHRPYLEAGWPCYAALPWLYDALDGRLRIVHLTRHPVATAFSMATHNVYGREDWVREGVLTPFDPGCLHQELQSAWPSLSIYEKCLFWWTQIHRYALDMHRERPDIPWLRVSFEDMFSHRTEDLDRLIEFCGLPCRPQLDTLRASSIDRFRFRMLPDDWRKILRQHETVAIAEALGYDIGDVDAHSLSQRYFRPKKSAHSLDALRFFLKKSFG
jgi:Sulfotransferase family